MARILIVDDDDEVAALFQETLEDAGHQVKRSAAAYGACLRCAKAEAPFDLVLMDLLLQGANGAVAALALRGLGCTAPILVVTGGLMPLDPELYRRAGFAGQLNKPLLPQDLVDEIARYLTPKPETA